MTCLENHQTFPTAGDTHGGVFVIIFFKVFFFDRLFYLINRLFYIIFLFLSIHMAVKLSIVFSAALQQISAHFHIMAEEINKDYELYKYVFVSLGFLNPFTEMYKTLD